MQRDALGAPEGTAARSLASEGQALKTLAQPCLAEASPTAPEATCRDICDPPHTLHFPSRAQKSCQHLVSIPVLPGTLKLGSRLRGQGSASVHQLPLPTKPPLLAQGDSVAPAPTKDQARWTRSGSECPAPGQTQARSPFLWALHDSQNEGTTPGKGTRSKRQRRLF